MDDLTWAPAWQLRERIATGDISAVEVVEATMKRLAAVEPQIHAFTTVCAEQARAAAREADAAVRSGRALGPLHGVPVVIKDEAWVGGVRATGGSLLFKDFVPAEDGTVAARLRAAGAIIIGMTNVPEFFTWSRTANRLGPETVNPWDTRRSPGASSGGTGAAIAAGVAPLGIGSDGGGSIRIPSAACGLVGLFPTPGRIPNTGSFSYARVGSLGPMARDVRDLAIAMDVLSGPDGHDARPCPPAREFAATLDQGVAGMRFLWSPDYGHIDADPAVAAQVGATAARLADAGAIVETAEFNIEASWPFFTDFLRGEVAYGNGPAPFTSDPAFVARCLDPENFTRLAEYNQAGLKAPPVSRESYEVAVKWVAALARKLDALFERYDAILSPTLPVVAPILPEGLADPYPSSSFCCGTHYTAYANLLELPALSFPAGLVNGMPVGLQVMGRHGREDHVLRIARALERLQPFELHPPLRC
jgi:Asp-tRNA(Asn)/Glu-tRNA(Gln) amidotransferase A subunit family amidase